MSIVCVVVGASKGVAQVRPGESFRDSSTVRIMAHVGRTANRPLLRGILRQSAGPSSAQKLDQIADSLTARALEAGASANTQSLAQSLDAVATLVLSGSTAPLGGQPYAGALNRLMTIHQRSTARPIRLQALGSMLSQASRSGALSYLRRVAESDDSTAYDAVEFLVTDAAGGSWASATPTPTQQVESTELLKAMAVDGRVHDRNAATLLDKWYAHYKPRPRKDGR